MTARFLAFAVLACCADTRPEAVHTFPLPDHWRKATSAFLIVEGLEAPKNRAVILRAITEDSSRKELGSYTLIAVSPEAKGNWEKPRVEINVIQAFREWAEGRGDTKEIKVRIRPHDGLKEASDYKWSAKSIRLEVR